MIKIVVDAFGGDNAPKAVIEGSIQAISNDKDFCVVLVGNEKIINNLLKEYSYNQDQIEIVNATDIIDNNESPTIAIRQKKNSSLVVALEYVKEHDDAVGIISAGSTGAVLTGAFLKLGRLKGVHRPALCPVLPTVKGGIVTICDCGANMDCKPEYLEQFGIMSSAYMSVLGVVRPRVALLNVGTENHKGDTLTKESFDLLKANKNINFVGNFEARDLLSGDYDIAVTDGFAGNVMLKSHEGAIKNLLKVLKSDIKSRLSCKIGALFMRKTFRNIKNNFDYSKFGGAVLLGCKKLVVKAHGSSKSESFKICIEQVKTMAKGNLIEEISKNLSRIGLTEDE